jgi:hypothetical protein
VGLIGCRGFRGAAGRGAAARLGAAAAALGAVGLGRPATALALLGLVTACAPSPAAAQGGGPWSVVSVRMTADLTADDGAAEVTLRYRLSGTPRGAPLPLDRPIPVELLGFAGATVEEIAVGEQAPVVLWPTLGSHRAAELEARASWLVEPGPEGGGEERGVLPLEITYRVENAIARDGAHLRGRLPVLSGPSPPEPGSEGGFAATLLLPEAWRLSEGFPTTIRAEQPGVWRVALPVTPAFVGFRARADGTWRPGLTLLVDALTLMALACYVAFGWRHLRRKMA